LAVAPLVGGAVWFAAAWARRVRIRRAALWSEETVRRALGAGRLGPTALAVAAFLGVVALAGPRWGEATIVAETRALSLVIAMDISRSMLAEDASPSRLGRALREGRRLVQDLDGDRVGLLAFAGSSYILSPLSIDGSALSLYLDALDPEVASEGGTGLAGALRQGGELLRASSDLADRVLVVFTDGEAHDSLAAVTEQAQRLHAAGIKLILVAEGGSPRTRIPMRPGSRSRCGASSRRPLGRSSRHDRAAPPSGHGIATTSPAPAPLIWPSSPRAARTTRRGTTRARRRSRTRMRRPRGGASRTPRRRSTPTYGSARSSTSACSRCARRWPTARLATYGSPMPSGRTARRYCSGHTTSERSGTSSSRCGTSTAARAAGATHPPGGVAVPRAAAGEGRAGGARRAAPACRAA